MISMMINITITQKCPTKLYCMFCATRGYIHYDICKIVCKPYDIKSIGCMLPVTHHTCISNCNERRIFRKCGLLLYDLASSLPILHGMEASYERTLYKCQTMRCYKTPSQQIHIFGTKISMNMDFEDSFLVIVIFNKNNQRNITEHRFVSPCILDFFTKAT